MLGPSSGGARHAPFDIGSGSGSVVEVLVASARSAIVVPGGDFALQASYERRGDDLVLRGDDGRVVVVREYFVQADAPDLVTAGGARVAGDQVEALSRALGPAQYAQAGGGAAAGAAAIGRVEKLTGSATAARPDGTRRELQVGDEVFQGEVLQTGQGSAIGVVFADRTTMALNENGRMLLDRFVYDPGARRGAMSLSVLQGAFLFVSGEINKMAQDPVQPASLQPGQSPTTIRTPVATIGVRGTIGGGNVQGEGLPNTFTLFPDPGNPGQPSGQMIIVNATGEARLLSTPFASTTAGSFFQSPTPVFQATPQAVFSTFGLAITVLPPQPPAPGVQGAAAGGGGVVLAGGSGVNAVVAALVALGLATPAGAPAAGVPQGGQAQGQQQAGAEQQQQQPQEQQRQENVGVPPPPEGNGFGSAFSGGNGGGGGSGGGGSGGGDGNGGGGQGDGGGNGGGGGDNGGGDRNNDNGGGGSKDPTVTIVEREDGSWDATGTPKADNITGTQFGDWLKGMGGGDLLLGAGGDDTLEGGAGDDILGGGTGNDTLIGDEGDDVLQGGTGDDTLDGGSGSDTADYGDVGFGVVVDLSPGDTVTVVLESELRNETDLLVGIENVSGGNGSDTLTGNEGSNTLRGGLGLDFLSGREGRDLLDGGGNTTGQGWTDMVDYAYSEYGIDLTLDSKGTVTLHVHGNDRDTLVGFEGAAGSELDDRIVGDDDPAILNNLWGRGGDDVLIGRDGYDILAGMSGDDTLVGGAMHDWMVGSLGDDVFLISGNDANYLEPDTFDGGSGTDTIQGTDDVIDILRVEDGLANLYNRDENDGGYVEFIDGGTGSPNTILASSGNDTLDFNAAMISVANFTIDGNSGDDVIVGTVASDDLVGGEGDDTLAGHAGTDEIDGGAGEDTVDFRDSESATVSLDRAAQVTATATYYSTSEIDVLMGIENATGGGGDDTLSGDGLGNTLRGEGGNDTLSGGDGLDFVDGGAGANDVVDYRYSTALSGLTLTLAGSGIATAAIGASDTDEVKGIEHVIGTSPEYSYLGDTIVGDANDNTLGGEGADDTLSGAGGNDKLLGGDGSDTVDYRYAANGIYLEVSGFGSVNVTVGSGDTDVIDHVEHAIGTNFDDTLVGDITNNVLDGAGGFDIVSWHYISAPIELQLDRDNPVAVTLAANDVDTIVSIEGAEGGSGDDILVGDSGGNDLSGYTGNDTLSGRDGDDVMDGDAGRDLVDYAYLSTAVTVTASSAGTVTVTLAGGERDTLSGFEDISGGSAGDLLSGDGAENLLVGGEGDDKLEGRGANDTLDGGAGIDLADYTYVTGAGNGFTAILDSAGTATVTVSGTDTDYLVAIENIRGGEGNDRLVGDAVANVIEGGLGFDQLRGGDGNDLLDGGSASDTVDYRYRTDSVGPGVTATLDAGGTVILTIASGDTDTLVRIENIIGSLAGDTLVGDGGDNALEGDQGNDTLQGKGGVDKLFGGTGSDTADYSYRNTSFTAQLDSANTVTVALAAGDTDALVSIENLVGGTGGDTLIGDNVANILSGGDGNDRLVGHDGNDLMVGGAGLDIADYAYAEDNVVVTLDSAGTATVVVGGAETDTLVGIENFKGGEGDDSITGDGEANTIFGAEANDTIKGAGGADALHGDDGNDVFLIAGGDGTDFIDGGAGTDTVRGEDGDNDILHVLSTFANLASVETLDGGTGTDNTVLATSGSDTLDLAGIAVTNFIVDGDAGNDTILGNGQADVFRGGAGNDLLRGLGGNDTFLLSGASSGTDSIDGGGGNDTILGIAGTTDILNVQDNLANLVSIERIDGLGGTDNTILATSGNDTLDFSGLVVVNFEIHGDAGADTIRGTAGIDVLRGGGGDDALRGDGGDDVLDGGAANDIVNYGYASSNLVIAIDRAATVIVGVATGDTDSLVGIEDIIGGTGNDTITGDTGANTIYGGDGQDSLSGGDGQDTLRGGNGNDTLRGGAGNDRLLGEADANVVDYRYLTTTALNVTLDAAGTVTVEVASGDTDTLEGIVGILGGDASDTLRGDSGANLISGGIGADTIRGGGGDDTLEGGDGNDVFQISGTSEGIDTVNGGNGSDTILSLTSTSVLNVASGLTNMVDVEKFQGTGIDTILGTTGNDVLDFSARTVTGFLVSGGAGDDQITMTGADDKMSGAAGNDTLFGGLGKDTADYSYLTGAGSGFTATLDAGTTVTVTVVAGTDVDKLVSIENIVGGSGDDRLVGDGSVNVIEGGAGNDFLSGVFDDDTLRGGDGNDTLLGGPGSDTLDGGLGLDVVDYALDPSAGVGVYARKTVGAFSATFTGNGDQDFLTSVEDIRGGSGSDTLSMRDASSFDDAVMLLGGNGSDVLVGRSGLLTGPPGLSDTLQGGSGSDSYYLVGRAEVSGNVLYDNSKGLPVIENIEDFTETIQIYSGTSYTGDYFSGFFELSQISGGYDGTNSGYGTPGVAVVIIDTSPGGYLYLDTDVTQPGYSVLARVLNGAENLTSGNVSIVDGTMTPPP